MNNLNAFGLKHIAVYLEDYSKGLLSFKEVCNYVSCCFEDRKQIMLIKKKSGLTGNTSTMDIAVTAVQIAAWQGGELIQNAMPNVSPNEREFIKSGITPAEWASVFGED